MTTSKKIYLLNCSIVTGPGAWSVFDVSPETAAQYALGKIDGPVKVVSAIGHEATAAAFSELIGTPVPVNRIKAELEVGDIAVVLQLKGRLPEGQILDRAALEEIGYSFRIMRRDAPAAEVAPDAAQRAAAQAAELGVSHVALASQLEHGSWSTAFGFRPGVDGLVPCAAWPTFASGPLAPGVIDAHGLAEELVALGIVVVETPRLDFGSQGSLVSHFGERLTIAIEAIEAAV